MAHRDSTKRPFDPRANSSVLLTYNEKLPGQSLLIKSAELPVKTFVVGPQRPPSARPSSAPATKKHAHHDPLAPRFLDRNGHFVASELPEQPRATQAQPLTATATATAHLQNSLMPTQRGTVRPVSAVYSYNDISPVVTGEHVREAGGHAAMTYTLGNNKLGLSTHGAAGVDHSNHNGPSATSPRSILDGHSALASPQASPKAKPATPQPAHHQRQAAGPPPPRAFMTTGGSTVHVGTSPYPGGFAAKVNSPYKEALPVRQVTADELDLHLTSTARAGLTTRTKPPGVYYTLAERSASSGRARTTRPASAGPAYRRGGASPGWQRAQHGGGDYLVGHVVGASGGSRARGQSARPARHGVATTGRTVGPWTFAEAGTQAGPRPGQPGYVEHPFSRTHAAGALPPHYDYYTHQEGRGSYGATSEVYYEGAGAYEQPQQQQRQFFNDAAAGGEDGAVATAVVDGEAKKVTVPNPYNPWNHKPGQGEVLTAADLKRTAELGRGVVAGTANARLIGGKWKVLERPVEGDVVYTDYYGRYGADPANYYGRKYEARTKDFTQNRLVEDNAYAKERASMMGIQALRDRPGLSVDTKLVHGTAEQLAKLGQASKAHQSLHHIPAYHNLRPASGVAQDAA